MTRLYPENLKFQPMPDEEFLAELNNRISFEIMRMDDNRPLEVRRGRRELDFLDSVCRLWRQSQTAPALGGESAARVDAPLSSPTLTERLPPIDGPAPGDNPICQLAQELRQGAPT